ncbi:MAG: RagB/SusD family nutrient uptake outer membrane protein [Bacteroidota bacterium]
MKIYKYLLLGFLVFAGISCEDQLELEPQQSVSTDAAFETLKDFENAVLGMYEGMQDQLYYGRNYPALGDASSDNGQIPDGAGARLTVFYTMALNPINTTGGGWERMYNVISRSNNIINRIDGLSTATEAERNQVKGEALFVRALVHFDLVRQFAQDYNFTSDQSHLGVPYIEVTEIGEPERNTVGEVYSNVLRDLNEAESLMGNTTSQEADQASKMAAVALRARLKLYMGDFSGALTDANNVIDNGGYSLANYMLMVDDDNDPSTPDVVDLDNIDSWSSPNPTSESIFELETSVTDQEFPGLEGLASIYQRDDGYGDLGPSLDIINLYDADDVRQSWYLNVAGVWFVEKYPGQGGNSQWFTTPILRLSEMVLIKAECHARLNQNTEAQTAINEITSRANAPAINSTGADLLADILEERRRELAFEGHRYFDLKRLQEDIVRNDCNLTNGNCLIPYGNRLFTYPIPQAETDANPNMIQDEGWRN